MKYEYYRIEEDALQTSLLLYGQALTLALRRYPCSSLRYIIASFLAGLSPVVKQVSELAQRFTVDTIPGLR